MQASLAHMAIKPHKNQTTNAFILVCTKLQATPCSPHAVWPTSQQHSASKKAVANTLAHATYLHKPSAQAAAAPLSTQPVHKGQILSR
jgi:hypothetical protein